jgi:hypothetical protein
VPYDSFVAFSSHVGFSLVAGSTDRDAEDRQWQKLEQVAAYRRKYGTTATAAVEECAVIIATTERAKLKYRLRES